MASNGSISLNLLVDKENNRVIFAEAEKDFVDVLCGFLTLPIGTVVRLLSKQLVIGCMNNLYKSVDNLDAHIFQNETSKTMLLRTRNSSEIVCRNLKVNIDDAELTKYYVCNRRTHVSTFNGTLCSCGLETKAQVYPNSTADGQVSKCKDVFIQGEASFLVTDDLHIIPMSAETTYDLLNNLGFQVTEALERKSVAINLNEVLLLLKNALYNTTTLTETFLREPKDLFCHSVQKSKGNIYSAVKAETASDIKNISLKIICRKSTRIPIYAEAGGDFVNILFSMLTFPLGAVVKLLYLSPSLGSVTNLYKNVEKLNGNNHIKSEDHMAMLVSPKLALQYGCKDQLLDITEVEHPPGFYTRYLCSKTLSNCRENLLSEDLVPLADFMKGEKKFMVTDDLVVTPFSSIEIITLHKQLKIPFNDIETRVVSIGENEALQILESSMASTSVLTSILKCATGKVPKQEKF